MSDIIDWLGYNLGTTAPLTGTDHRALRAAHAIIELYAYDREPMLLTAFGIVVRRMQAKTREYAYHAIAQVLDWKDRAVIWEQAALPRIENPIRCTAEPKGGAA